MAVGEEEIIMEYLKSKIAYLPQAAGVYIFKDSAGRIIYIGKAKSLRKRVQSYFSRALDSKTQAMVERIAGVEYRLAPNEAQAQILEAALIKEKQPQYNIDLKDDKSFPWIRITNEMFPVVSIYRKKGKQKNDTSLYFGPYTSVKLLRQAVKLIRRVFGFRSCRVMPDKPCLYYRMKLCPAPCIGKIGSAEYGEIIERIKMFLLSRYEALINNLSEKMKKESGVRNYEEAAKIRDQLNALSAIAAGAKIPARAGDRGLEELKDILKLDGLPLRIEAFDISNIGGREATGSMVSFYKAEEDKNNYRRFRIKTVSASNDYAMLGEIIRRRYTGLIKERLPFPDLILIDGGKGQLHAAKEVLDSLGLKISLISIAKKEEELYTLGKARPLRLKNNSAALRLIQHIRDESHRFAIKYHRFLRKRKTFEDRG